MRLKSRRGLMLVELVVVTCALLLLVLMIPSMQSGAFRAASVAAIGANGKDIYVSIVSANVELEALGLQPLWPRDSDLLTGTNRAESGRVNFTNSTEYFKWLVGEGLPNTSNLSPHGVAFDYSKLAGAGVPVCGKGQLLSASNNLWTIVKNVRDDMHDIVPVLITRNIDASSLVACQTEQDLQASKELRFDPKWERPFSNKGLVLIRKGGAVVKAGSWRRLYYTAYQSYIFDTSRTPDGRAAPPLKYLTPDREVVPGG